MYNTCGRKHHHTIRCDSDSMRVACSGVVVAAIVVAQLGPVASVRLQWCCSHALRCVAGPALASARRSCCATPLLAAQDVFWASFSVWVLGQAVICIILCFARSLEPGAPDGRQDRDGGWGRTMGQVKEGRQALGLRRDFGSQWVWALAAVGHQHDNGCWHDSCSFLFVR